MYTAKIINPNNTFTLGWKEGITYVFSEENHENDMRRFDPKHRRPQKTR